MFYGFNTNHGGDGGVKWFRKLHQKNEVNGFHCNACFPLAG